MTKQAFLLTISLFSFQIAMAQEIWNHGELKVTNDGHALEHKDGTPFFWLGDTAWELFHRLKLEEIKTYLDNRQKKGFNVIQVVAIPTMNGLKTPNVYGELPLIDLNPARPNPAFFHLIDTVIQMALKKNMAMAILPTWGDNVSSEHPFFNVSTAYTYGKFLGDRYKRYPNIVWVLGGDHSAYTEKNDWRPAWRSMARGIREGAQKPVLISFHPGGIMWESALQVHNEEWLDFNMIQSGHSEVDQPVWKTVERDYNLKPSKPVLDAEPAYEDHPIHPWPTWNPANGYFRDYEVRRQLYRSVFSGAFGVTYGHHAVWQFYSPEYEKINYADRFWYDALDRPAAFQAGFLKKLIDSGRYFRRIPQQSLILTGQGEKSDYITVFRDDKGRYILAYLPVGKQINLNTSVINSTTLSISWFNPRTGQTKHLKDLNNKGSLQLNPPETGKIKDWVLIIAQPGH